MRWKQGWRRFARMWQSDTTANVDEELRFHFEQKIAELEAQGLSAREAQLRAVAEFGDVALVKNSLQEIDHRLSQKRKRAEWWECASQDLRYVVRSLSRSPLFTGMVIVTLSLGLGANAALFSMIDRLYVQNPQGVRDATAVQRVYLRERSSATTRTRAAFNYPQLRSLREIAPAGLEIAGYSVRGLPPWSMSNVRAVLAVYVVGDYFGVLGVKPALGRFFTKDEREISGLSMTAVISHDLWTRRFQSDPNIVGQIVDIGAHHHQIIGVAPPGFHGVDMSDVDVWAPQNSRGILRGRSLTWYEENHRILSLRVITRTPSEAVSKLFSARATELMRRDPLSTDSVSQTFLGSLIQSRVDGSQSSQLKVSTRLAGVSLIILIIACANVVNLLLARSASRERETALRLALGVRRVRLVMQSVTESVVLALVSASFALVIAFAGTVALRRLLFPYVRFGANAIDARAAMYTMIVALAVGVVIGVIPALQFSRPNLSSALKSGIRDGGRVRSNARTSMLVAQVALSLILLAGAGVFVRSMQRVEALNPGFDADRLFFAQVDYNIEEGDRGAEFARRLPEAAERLRRIPGIDGVALADGIPFLQSPNGAVFLPGRDSVETNTGDGQLRAVVSAEYFSTLGIKVVQGRAFANVDRFGSEPVIILSQQLAQRLFVREDPLTKCVIPDKRSGQCRRVVGVVEPTRDVGIIQDPPMKYYLPLAQLAGEVQPEAIAVRTDPRRIRAVELAVSRELSELYGPAAMPSIESIDLRVKDELHTWRTGAELFGAAGLLALLVAAVGVYSSMAYLVSQRRQEMGVRIALGASSASLVGLIVQQGVRIVASGVAIGLVLALAIATMVASMLYETSPRDPLVFASSAVTLLVVAVLACAVPAWRASRVDPLAALRSE